LCNFARRSLHLRLFGLLIGPNLAGCCKTKCISSFCMYITQCYFDIVSFIYRNHINWLTCLVYFDVYVFVPNISYCIGMIHWDSLVLQHVFCQSVFEEICGVGGIVDSGQITRRTSRIWLFAKKKTNHAPYTSGLFLHNCTCKRMMSYTLLYAIMCMFQSKN
jgi:hypothetical protein